MPLKLNVGLSRKVGESNFGSRGASVNFEVELEHSLVREPDQLREKVRYLFGLAKEAVEQELSGHVPPVANDHGTNGHNGNGTQRPANGRPATGSQVRAINAIAGRQRLDLSAELRSRFSVDRPDDLSISEASQVIDELKSSHSGNGGKR